MDLMAYRPPQILLFKFTIAPLPRRARRPRKRGPEKMNERPLIKTLKIYTALRDRQPPFTGPDRAQTAQGKIVYKFNDFIYRVFPLGRIPEAGPDDHGRDAENGKLLVDIGKNPRLLPPPYYGD